MEKGPPVKVDLCPNESWGWWRRRTSDSSSPHVICRSVAQPPVSSGFSEAFGPILPGSIPRRSDSLPLPTEDPLLDAVTRTWLPTIVFGPWFRRTR